MKLGLKEKTAHAIGGVGHNLIYALFSGYLLIFYTDVFGLSSAFTGTLFLVARIWDAFNNPFFGAIRDRTHSHWGRYRPWLFFSAPIGYAKSQPQNSFVNDGFSSSDVSLPFSDLPRGFYRDVVLSPLQKRFRSHGT
jgi:hypothetical protein